MTATAPSDRRLLRSNGRVADIALQGQVTAERFVMPAPRCVERETLALRAAPSGNLDKQLVQGQTFHVLEERDGCAFGYDPVDGYVGYAPMAGLGPAQNMTHRVVARASHSYGAPDIKAGVALRHPFGARLRIIGEEGAFFQTQAALWVPKQHLSALGQSLPDPAGVCETLLGTPYLWAGNTDVGIDCSGLTQTALHLSGRACPRDSDMQEAAFPEVTGACQRGDLVFWKGHVGMLLDEGTLIHANAHHMAVAVEPLDQAVARIAKKEFGEITKIARP